MREREGGKERLRLRERERERKRERERERGKDEGARGRRRVAEEKEEWKYDKGSMSDARTELCPNSMRHHIQQYMIIQYSKYCIYFVTSIVVSFIKLHFYSASYIS